MKNKNKIILFVFILANTSMFAQLSLFDGTNGSGTEYDPYTIYTKYHLDELTDSVNNSAPGINNWSKDKYFILMNDIDDSVRVPIGIGIRNSTTHINYPFQGIFDGQNYKITLAINTHKPVINGDTIPVMYLGLFSMAYNTKISNVIVDGYIINNHNSVSYYSSGVGSVVGHCFDDCEFYNCKSYVDIFSSYSWAGGIIGLWEYYNCGIIDNCINYGNIESDYNYPYGAGIVSHLSSTGLEINVINCINFGKIISVGGSGIVGVSEGPYNTIINCINCGEIVGHTSRSGGIIEILGGGKLFNCINIGNIICMGNAGGIAETIVRTATITNCINIANIEGNFNIGGIVGHQPTYDSSHIFPNPPTIINCSNSGYIKGNTNVGGIMGLNGKNTTITNCINTGVVEGKEDVGAIVGKEE